MTPGAFDQPSQTRRPTWGGRARAAALGASVLAAVASASGSALAQFEPYLGQMMIFGAKSGGRCPVGWLPADGRTLAYSTPSGFDDGLAALYSVLGSRFGDAGPGTFKLPMMSTLSVTSSGPEEMQICIAVSGFYPSPD